MKFSHILAAAAFALSCASALAEAPAKTADGTLVDGKGMTLYTFDKDPAGEGKSACNGPCVGNWPPLMAEEGAMASGDWAVATRDDGKKQWTYKGKPLYRFVKDQKPGDHMGEGMLNNMWHTAKP